MALLDVCFGFHIRVGFSGGLLPSNATSRCVKGGEIIDQLSDY
jgi:hypothetical protein